MTDTKTDAEGSRIIADGLAAVEALRAHTAVIDQARDSQPERLRAARAAADAAREQCLADPDEHWLTQVRAIPTYTADGELAGKIQTPRPLPPLVLSPRDRGVDNDTTEESV